MASFRRFPLPPAGEGRGEGGLLTGQRLLETRSATLVPSSPAGGRRLRTTIIVTLLLLTCAARAQTEESDLREFSVGMPFTALPPHGYTGFTCVAGSGEALGGWADYAKCPTDAAGRHEVGFRYDDKPEHETKVAGQPMRLSLLLGEDGTVDGIRMRTDPTARLFLHKRGYIFGEQVKARYGETGWACSEAAPSGTEEGVGGIFVREHCEKTIGIRHLVLDRELFRRKEDVPAKFTSGTDFIVYRVAEKPS